MASKFLSINVPAKLARHNKLIAQAFSTNSQSQYLPFDTLHSLTANATKRYETNPLFGTFSNDQFQWMTYGEFGRRVQLCRGLLRDVGTFCPYVLLLNDMLCHSISPIAFLLFKLCPRCHALFESRHHI